MDSASLGAPGRPGHTTHGVCRTATELDKSTPPSNKLSAKIAKSIYSIRGACTTHRWAQHGPGNHRIGHHEPRPSVAIPGCVQAARVATNSCATLAPGAVAGGAQVAGGLGAQPAARAWPRRPHHRTGGAFSGAPPAAPAASGAASTRTGLVGAGRRRLPGAGARWRRQGRSGQQRLNRRRPGGRR